MKNNDEVNILTFEDEKAVEVMRHSTSHVMAQAVKRVFKNLKLAIGPSRDNGFYYDFDLEEPLTIEDLNKTEKEVSNIYIKAFKLTSVAGAYWRGNEKNKMLQRVYGVAFASKEDLKTYLHNLEEVKKRDHRKLGKDLKLFTFVEEGPGFPIFLHKGVVLKNILINYWRDVHQKAGYVEIETPIMLNKKLWETSGYWYHYKENMYTSIIDEEEFVLKPMNCPGGMLVYKSEVHSYKDVSMRLCELGRVHRHELSGALHGLMRVREFTQVDANIFMLLE